MSEFRNFHVPLQSEMYLQLQEVARRESKPATAMAREAIAQLLEQKRREILQEAIAAYAARFAGSEVDLDPELEEAAVESLLAED